MNIVMKKATLIKDFGPFQLNVLGEGQLDEFNEFILNRYTDTYSKKTNWKLTEEEIKELFDYPKIHFYNIKIFVIMNHSKDIIGTCGVYLNNKEGTPILKKYNINQDDLCKTYNVQKDQIFEWFRIFVDQKLIKKNQNQFNLFDYYKILMDATIKETLKLKTRTLVFGATDPTGIKLAKKVNYDFDVIGEPIMSFGVLRYPTIIDTEKLSKNLVVSSRERFQYLFST